MNLPYLKVIADIACIILLYCICLFVPGYMLLRNKPLPDTLKLIASISLSVFILFVVSFVYYLLGAGKTAYILAILLLVAVVIVIRKDLYTFLRAQAPKTLLVHYGIFLSWVFTLTMYIRYFSGGQWSVDWEEHYQRSLFFSEHYPLDTMFGSYLLPARPPLYNVVAAFFLKIFGSDYYYYQLISILLNSTVFFGAYAVVFAYVNEDDRTMFKVLPILTLILCLSPFMMENGTYPWTRGLTNFMVLLSIALYYLSVKLNDMALRSYSYLSMGISLLVHYSAAPYVLGLVLIDIYFLLRGRRSLTHVLMNVGLITVVFSIWLAFSLYYYGTGMTFGANSTVIESSGLGLWQNTLKVCTNIVNTIVPHFLRPDPNFAFTSDPLLCYIRDYAFLPYQTNILPMLGSTGWMFVLYSFAKKSAASVRYGDRELTLLAVFFIAWVFITGIAVNGGYDYFGVAHICLQPLAIMGLAYLAANFWDYGIVAKAVILAGLLVDLVFGILLQIWVEHYSLNYVQNAISSMASPGPSILYAYGRVLYKTDMRYKYMSDIIYSGYITAFFIVVLALLIIYAVYLYRKQYVKVYK